MKNNIGHKKDSLPSRAFFSTLKGLTLMLSVTVFDDSDSGKIFRFSKDRVSIGRSGRNDLSLSNSHISSNHGEIRKSKGTYRYKDLGSTNGSMIRRKGKEIYLSARTLSEYPLVDGDEIVLGAQGDLVVIKLNIETLPDEERPVPLGESTIVKVLPLRQMDRWSEAVLKDSRAIDELYRFIRLIQPADRVEDVYKVTSEAVLEIFDKASHVMILRSDPEADEYLPVKSQAREEETSEEPPPLSRAIVERVVHSGEAVLFKNAPEEFEGSESLAASRVLSGICCPLSYQGRVTGVLQATSKEDTGLFNTRDLEILTLAGNQLAMKLHNLELIQSLQNAQELLRIENENLERRVSQRTKDLEDTLEELKSTQSQLVHSQQMASLGTLVAGIAHELNNPISFIYDNLDFLETYIQAFVQINDFYDGIPMDEKKRQEIELEKKRLNLDYVRKDIQKLQENFREGAERTRRIVKDLRTFSRLDEAERKEVDLHQGLESTLALLSNRLKHVIRVHRQYGKLPYIECFPGQINQVFMNLLMNAADAIEGEGDIWISTYFEEEETDVRIEIKDNGKGIPDEAIPNLFVPFFTTKEVGKGTGLGLSISYGIVERHGGRIEVKSMEGEGAVFTVVLPLKLPEELRT